MHLARLSIAVVLATLGLACGGATSATTPSDGGIEAGDADAETSAPWPMFQRTPGHTGRASGPLGQSPSLKWTFAAGTASQAIGAAAVGSNDTVYVPSSAAAGTPATLFALHSDGSLAWSAALGNAPLDPATTPVVGLDGSVYVQVVQSGVVFAFDSDGHARWQTPPGSDGVGISEGSDGTIFAGFLDGRVLALDPVSGSARWQFQCDAPIGSYVASGTDGSIFVSTTTSNKLFAVLAGGGLSWTLPLSSQATSPPVVGDDGTVYIGTLDKQVLAVDRTGTVKWAAATPASVTSLALGDGPTAYAVSNDLASTHALSAIDATGQVRWSATFTDNIQPPIVTGDGYVVLNLFGGGLDVVSPSGTASNLVSFGASPTSYGLAVTTAGLLLVGSGDGKLYAFGF